MFGPRGPCRGPSPRPRARLNLLEGTFGYAAAQLQPIDLVVCGSVAVNRNGDRIGKGAGYSDLEVALLHDAGLLRPHTIIATTVHPPQVLDEELPATDHDFEVNFIITPDQVIPCEPARERSGVIWDDLAKTYRDVIPALGSLTRRARG
jgi:5-formyltetrahydrofolate cyclo-ligase